MRKLTALIHSLLLITTPCLLAQNGLPRVQVQKVHVETEEQESPLNNPWGSYDDILHLLEQVESGELEEKCSEEELEKVNQYLAFLASEGILPDDAQDMLAFEQDVQELLQGKDNPYEYAFHMGDVSEYMVIPAVLGYKDVHAMLCKNWLQKRWHVTKEFVKKHKKQIIVGAAIVVAVVVVVAVVASTAGAAAAGAAGAASAAASSAKGKSTAKGATSSVPEKNSSSDPMFPEETPMLRAAFEEQISSFKETLVSEQLFQPSMEGISWEENGRALGSLFAHESLKNLHNQIADYPRLEQEIQEIAAQYTFPLQTATGGVVGHPEIDRRFSTEYSHWYASSAKEMPFTTLTYQARGEKAIEFGCYTQAVQDFGRVIEMDPTNSLAYLGRGIAHFQTGQYEHSLEDYRKFAAQAKTTPPFSLMEFTQGAAKGLPKGVYESGEGILLFLAEFVQRPIHTAGQMIEAFTTLASLVHSEEWKMIGQALVPEVYQLVTQWDTLPSKKRGELAGYALGKYGADILVPGALAKLTAKGAKGAGQLVGVCNNLKRAEEMLILEVAAGMRNDIKAKQVIEIGQQVMFYAEELGYSGPEIGQLKQARKLKATVTKDLEHLSQAKQDSIAKHKNALDELKLHKKQTMSEERARALIHETGFPTFPRPKGVPEDYLVMISSKGAGMEYVHPRNTHTRIRVMPGKLHSQYPHQQKPYVVQMRDGKILDEFGNVVLRESPEAHIPLDQFVYKGG